MIKAILGGSAIGKSYHLRKHFNVDYQITMKRCLSGKCQPAYRDGWYYFGEFRFDRCDPEFDLLMKKYPGANYVVDISHCVPKFIRRYDPEIVVFDTDEATHRDRFYSRKSSNPNRLDKDRAWRVARNEHLSLMRRYNNGAE